MSLPCRRRRTWTTERTQTEPTCISQCKLAYIEYKNVCVCVFRTQRRTKPGPNHRKMCKVALRFSPPSRRSGPLRFSRQAGEDQSSKLIYEYSDEGNRRVPDIDRAAAAAAAWALESRSERDWLVGWPASSVGGTRRRQRPNRITTPCRGHGDRLSPHKTWEGGRSGILWNSSTTAQSLMNLIIFNLLTINIPQPRIYKIARDTFRTINSRSIFSQLCLAPDLKADRRGSATTICNSGGAKAKRCASP